MKNEMRMARVNIGNVLKIEIEDGEKKTFNK